MNAVMSEEILNMLTAWLNKEPERNDLTSSAAMTQPDRYSGTGNTS